LPAIQVAMPLDLHVLQTIHQWSDMRSLIPPVLVTGGRDCRGPTAHIVIFAWKNQLRIHALSVLFNTVQHTLVSWIIVDLSAIGALLIASSLLLLVRLATKLERYILTWRTNAPRFAQSVTLMVSSAMAIRYVFDVGMVSATNTDSTRIKDFYAKVA
jgi:hypothetical protein